MCNKGISYYIKELLTIAYPIIIVILGFILIGVGDVVIAGRHSTDTFAAISISNAIVNVIMTLSIGIISGISPLLSNYRGEKQVIKKYFYPSIRFSMCMALLTSVLILLCVPVIPHIGFESHLISPIQEYMLITALSTFGGCLHICLKEFLQAYEIVLFPNLLTLFAVVLNVLLNIIFVFGWGIIPSMGVIGLAVASLLVRYFMGFALLIYCYMNMTFKNYTDKNYYKQLIKIGFPISISILIEFVAFNSVVIFMGRIAGIYAAAQTLLCTLTTISFMVPFAISNAIAVKVGFSNGAKNYVDLKKYSVTGTTMSVLFMMLSASIFLLFPKQIVGLFTVDDNLYKIALPVLAILGVFQIFDGLQVSFSGICKGIKQTQIVLAASFVAYWLIAIPLGYVLAFKYNMNLIGSWIGLLASSFILCLIMFVKLFSYYKNNILKQI